jgi:hypothetical protein
MKTTAFGPGIKRRTVTRALKPEKSGNSVRWSKLPPHSVTSCSMRRRLSMTARRSRVNGCSMRRPFVIATTIISSSPTSVFAVKTS